MLSNWLCVFECVLQFRLFLLTWSNYFKIRFCIIFQDVSWRRWDRKMHRKDKNGKFYYLIEFTVWVKWPAGFRPEAPEIQSNQKLTQSNHREMQSDFKEMQNGCREMGRDHRGRGSIICRLCPEFLNQPRPEAKVSAELLILCLIILLLILWPSLQMSCFLTLELFLHAAHIWYGWAAGERGCLISKEWSALSKYVALHHVPHISAFFFCFRFSRAGGGTEAPRQS